jgi:hypothetical protein
LEQSQSLHTLELRVHFFKGARGIGCTAFKSLYILSNGWSSNPGMFHRLELFLRKPLRPHHCTVGAGWPLGALSTHQASCLRQWMGQWLNIFHFFQFYLLSYAMIPCSPHIVRLILRSSKLTLFALFLMGRYMSEWRKLEQ